MEAIECAKHAHSDGMGAFVCFLSVRLMGMRRILKPSGSIFVHCDHSAGAYIRCVMDAIFGSKNFRNEIVWRRAPAKHTTKTLGKNHDTLLWYCKGEEDYYYNPPLREHSQRTLDLYRHKEEGTGRWYCLEKLTANTKNRNPNQYYELMGVWRYWCWKQPRMMEAVEAGLVVQTKPGNVPRLKKYLDEMHEGVPLDSIWNDVKRVESGSKENTNYPTQKPIDLYSRIVGMACPPGGVVLDPFLGSGTTAIASEKLGRQWIGMDRWEETEEAIDKRIRRIESYMKDGGRIILKTKGEKRTDNGETACPTLPNKFYQEEPPGPKLSTAQIKARRIKELGGNFCEGCNRKFAHPSYLEVDHNTPRSSYGLNHYSNRILLCPPCNKRKSNLYTLEWLRKENRRKGFMVDQEVNGQAGDIEPESEKPTT